MPFIPALIPILAANAGAIGTAALIGGGVAAGVSAMNQPKQDMTIPQAPPIPPLTPAPTPTTAQESAQAAVEKQRRMRALSGGKTLLTSEGPTLSSGAGKSLLGS